ncbi:DUF1566 domain-containing protein [Streptomyces sp. NPDC059894]|uniref:Lcl C-terminal domain-containing protein n=1 Tax=unclassified Streptomyces TaxID=2593676 RepID=UPI0036564DE2
MTAAEATEYCRNLGLDGQRWRLPGLKELATTVDDSRVAPAIDPAAFPATQADAWYWSTSASTPEPGNYWALNYEDGYTNYREVTAGYVRCVR